MQMRKMIAVAAIALTAVAGGCGFTEKVEKRTSIRPPDEWDIGAYRDAHRYADWCGGIVTDPFGQEGGPYVVDCDK